MHKLAANKEQPELVSNIPIFQWNNDNAITDDISTSVGEREQDTHGDTPNKEHVDILSEDELASESDNDISYSDCDSDSNDEDGAVNISDDN